MHGDKKIADVLFRCTLSMESGGMSKSEVLGTGSFISLDKKIKMNPYLFYL